MYPGEVVLEGLAAVGRKALPDVGRKLEAGRLELPSQNSLFLREQIPLSTTYLRKI